MPKLKQYKVAGFNYFEATFEVNEDLLQEKTLAEVNNFCSDSEERLADANGSLLRAVLNSYFTRIQWLIAEAGGWPMNVPSIIDAFAWKDSEGNGKNGQEGFFELDGSHGIRLVDYTCELELDEPYSFEEIPNVAA